MTPSMIYGNATELGYLSSQNFHEHESDASNDCMYNNNENRIAYLACGKGSCWVKQ